ncbi:MAG: V-type ATPase subunit [Bacillota bacterium]|nr:V-type ATPase subunit [Bacillota bacterium]
MGNVENFAALNTKIKALQGKMLTESQYNGLLKTKNYYEALKYLKENTYYSEALKDINILDIHRGDLEIILKKYYVDIFFKLNHFVKGNFKEMLQLLFLQLQIEDLKVIFRAKYVDKKEDIRHLLITYGSPMNQIPYDELIAEKNMEALSKKLKDRKLFKHIPPLLFNFNNESLFRLEMALDFEYFSAVRKFIKTMDEDNGEILREINGSIIDMLNVQWIYRGRHYYKLSPEELFNYTIYKGNKINSCMIRKLCYAKDDDEFYSLISGTVYGSIFVNARGKDYLIEKETNTFIKKQLSRYRSTGKLNISLTLSYIQLMEIELRDIISIVENKRYMYEESKAVEYITKGI